MATITRLPSGHWRVRIRRTGAPLLSRTFPTRVAADRWAAEQEAAVTSGGTTLPLAVRDYRQALHITVKDLLDRYFESFHYNRKSPSTQAGERRKSPHVLAHLGDYAVSQLTPALIASYRDTRLRTFTARGRPVSADQVRLEMSLLCVILQLAATEWNLIASNPCRGVSKPSGEHRERRLSEDEERRLRTVLAMRNDGRRLNRFVLVAFYTGMRAGEVASLKKANVNLETRQIRLLSAQTKNRKPRLIPVSDQVANLLRKAIAASPADCPYVFPTQGRDGTWKRYEYACAWRRTLKRAGIEDLRVHDLRHEFVSRLFEDTDLSDGKIAALSGHTDPRSLWRYRHLRSEALRPTVEAYALELVERPVMDEVEDEITSAMHEATFNENADWVKVERILGKRLTALLKKGGRTMRENRQRMGGDGMFRLEVPTDFEPQNPVEAYNLFQRLAAYARECGHECEVVIPDPKKPGAGPPETAHRGPGGKHTSAARRKLPGKKKSKRPR